MMPFLAPHAPSDLHKELAESHPGRCQHKTRVYVDPAVAPVVDQGVQISVERQECFFA